MSFGDILLTVAIIAGKSLFLLSALLIFIAYALYADRKIWAAVQIAPGPQRGRPMGPAAILRDLLKFVLKEPIIPAGANKGLFLLAPLIFATLALAAWAVIPFDLGWVIADINVGVLYIFAISSLGVYGVIMGGWASNSKYAFLGTVRSAAQMVSYEVSIGFVIITVLMCAGSLNLSRIVAAQDTALGHAGLVLALAVPDVRDLRHLRRWRRRTGRRRPARGRVGSSSPAIWSSTPPRPISCSCSASTWRSSPCARWRDPVPRRLAVADPVCALHLGAGRRLVRAEGELHLLHHGDGQGDGAALPLRPAHAARLEGVSAHVRWFRWRCRAVLKLTGLAPG
jgi:hypothetical protein